MRTCKNCYYYNKERIKEKWVQGVKRYIAKCKKYRKNVSAFYGEICPHYKKGR